MDKKYMLAVLMILLAATGWGIIGIFTRPLNAVGLNALQITFIRSAITSIGMGIFLFLKDKSLLKINMKDIWIFLGTGLISIVLFNICYFMTIEHTTLAAASVLLYTAPCFVMIMSACIFKERVNFQKLTALILAFVGCLLASGFAMGDINALVLFTGIGAALGYAAYSIFGKIALKKYHAFTIVFYTFSISAIGLSPLSHVSMIIPALSHDTHVLLVAFGLGIASTLVPFISYTCGLKHVEAGKASVMAFAEPLVATLAGIIVFGEVLHITNIIGIVLIFFAIVLLNISIFAIRKKRIPKSTKF